MPHNKFILSCIAVFLVYDCADASQKRPREDSVEGLPKRIKLVCPEPALATLPQRHDKMYYCERDIFNCSFVTPWLGKIEKHHAHHDAPSALSCRKCDFLGENSRSMINHESKWHMTEDSHGAARTEPVIKQSTIQTCEYCGREGSNMKRHNEVYHTPKFGKRSYFQCFQLYRPVALPISSNSSSETE